MDRDNQSILTDCEGVTTDNAKLLLASPQLLANIFWFSSIKTKLLQRKLVSFTCIYIGIFYQQNSHNFTKRGF